MCSRVTQQVSSLDPKSSDTKLGQIIPESEYPTEPPALQEWATLKLEIKWWDGGRRSQRPKSHQTRTGRRPKVLNRGSQTEGLGVAQNDMGWPMWEHQANDRTLCKPPRG